MGQLATPYRIVYQAKNFTTGVTGVVAFVMKPNNAMAGPFPMTEMASPFLGNYYCDFFTTSSDPQGEYLEMIFSPNEGIKSSKKFGLYAAPDIAGLNAAIAQIEAAAAVLENQAGVISSEVATLTEEINLLSNISDTLVSAAIPAQITASVETPPIVVKISSNSIVGIVSDENSIGDYSCS